MFSMVENQAKYLHDVSGHMSADQLISAVETGSITVCMLFFLFKVLSHFGVVGVHFQKKAPLVKP